MRPTTQAPATLDDLYMAEGEAESIGGRVVHSRPGQVADAGPAPPGWRPSADDLFP